MKSNTITIIKKELARVFGDRQLLFTSILMPGLLIYIIYSLMGNGIEKIVTSGEDDIITLKVENMPTSLTPTLLNVDSTIQTLPIAFNQTDIDELKDKKVNNVLLRFPANFDFLIQNYSPQSGEPAPNVELYYNSSNIAAMRSYSILNGILTSFEENQVNLFDINRVTAEQVYDMVDRDEVLTDVWSKILPMLIIMLLFGGTMGVAPSAIAGEKERGTIATLLVTPMKRSELAVGKIVSISIISLLSGLSSFIGIVLSLPKIMRTDADVSLGLNFSASDYAVLLLVIFATVLIMAAFISLLSALARDTKNASTMVTPLMFVFMLAGMIPLFQTEVSTNIATYLIPVYNSVEVMSGVFSHSTNWGTLITTLCVNVAFAAVSVWVLSKMFNSEKIMFRQ
ncbi:MAG: ABC transporter permease [Bacteroidales bacterium]|nr:ABC transporter permease [Bacteroidales bacterium]